MLCTDDKTFRVREAYHSNSLFVSTANVSSNPAYSHCKSDSVILLDNIPAIWETVAVDNDRVSLPNSIPVYKGIEETKESSGENSRIGLQRRKMTLHEIKHTTAISKQQFDKLWRENAGVEVMDYEDEEGQTLGYIIHRLVIWKVLNGILAAIETGVVPYLTINNIYPGTLQECLARTGGKKQDEPFTVIESIVRKFSDEPQEPYSLNIPRITHWYGINTLQEHEEELLDQSEFLSLWKQSFPIAVLDPLELSTLEGNYINMSEGKIIYFTKETLSNDPKERIGQLLSIKPAWELPEILPFIQDIIPKTSKVDSFIMKFARKKTVGKKIIISKR